MSRRLAGPAPATRTDRFPGPSNGVLVLGTQHSGLGTVSAALRAAGLTQKAQPSASGDSRPAPSDFAELLLDSLDWAWDAPAAIPTLRTPGRPDLDAIGEAFTADARSRWYVADARNSLLLPWWRDAITDRFVGLLVIRDPLEVARRLMVERSVPLPYALALWRAYHRHLFAGIAGHRLVITNYAALVTKPVEVVPMLLDALHELGVDGPLDARAAVLAISNRSRRRTGPSLRSDFSELAVAATKDFARLSQRPLVSLRTSRLDFPPPTSFEVALLDSRRTAAAAATASERELATTKAEAQAESRTLRADLQAQQSLVRASRVEAQSSAVRASVAEWRRDQAKRSGDSQMRLLATTGRTLPGHIAHRWMRIKEGNGLAQRLANSLGTARSVVALQRPWWLRQHPLFDPDWYAQRYPDAATGRLSAWRHYVRHGVHEGRQPNEYLDLTWYLDQYDDVPRSLPMALDHYLRVGPWEGKDPGPDFVSHWYLLRYADVAAAGMNPLLHYLRHGRLEGRARHARDEEDLTPASSLPLAMPPAPRVSIVMTTYESAEFVGEAIRSIISQDFTDWELIVVDDASSDHTVDVVDRLTQTDPRIRLFASNRNHGTYWCKNFGLTQSKGEFVTFQDSDDRSDPTRLKRQVAAMESHPEATAVSTDYVRIDSDGTVLANRGAQQRRAFISLMFRRPTVLSKIGYFDSVRTSADEEHFERLQKVFGRRGLVDLNMVLYRALVRGGSLTGSSGSRVRLDATPEEESDLSFLSDERRQYVVAFRAWHARNAEPYMPFPLAERPFPAPSQLLRPGRRLQAEGVAAGRPALRSGHTADWLVKSCHEDDVVTGPIDVEVVILSDFRFAGGTSQANVAEIEALARAGHSIALCQADSSTYSGAPAVHTGVQRLVEGGKARWLSVGDRVDCRLLVIRHPTVIGQLHELRVRIDADRIVVIANQVPADRDGSVYYNVIECQDVMRRVFGRVGTWYPISSSVRTELAAVSGMAGLAPDDWHEIIDVDAWTADRSYWRSDRAVIGRHSRPSPAKWPADAATIRQVYPTDGSALVHVLGGADTALELLGAKPTGWTTYDFGEVEPRDFLAGLDFFVYYHHPDIIEAFGRTILEALASGLPVVVPPHFETTFGEAAIYAEPRDVQSVIARLRSDRDAYEAQSKRGITYARRHFSYQTHVQRTLALLAPVDISDGDPRRWPP